MTTRKTSGNVSHSVDAIGVTVFAALGLFVALAAWAKKGTR